MGANGEERSLSMFLSTKNHSLDGHYLVVQGTCFSADFHVCSARGVLLFETYGTSRVQSSFVGVERHRINTREMLQYHPGVREGTPIGRIADVFSGSPHYPLTDIEELQSYDIPDGSAFKSCNFSHFLLTLSAYKQTFVTC
jgi:hypothetical protein